MKVSKDLIKINPKDGPIKSYVWIQIQHGQTQRIGAEPHAHAFIQCRDWQRQQKIKIYVTSS